MGDRRPSLVVRLFLHVGEALPTSETLHWGLHGSKTPRACPSPASLQSRRAGTGTGGRRAAMSTSGPRAASQVQALVQDD